MQAKGSAQPIDRQTSLWLSEIGQTLHDKFSKAGLIEQREASTLGKFLRLCCQWSGHHTVSGFNSESANDVYESDQAGRPEAVAETVPESSFDKGDGVS